MCPVCIGSTALYIASGTSAGGFALLVRRMLRRMIGFPRAATMLQPK